jgi:hypothetical protein
MQERTGRGLRMILTCRLDPLMAWLLSPQSIRGVLVTQVSSGLAVSSKNISGLQTSAWLLKPLAHVLVRDDCCKNTTWAYRAGQVGIDTAWFSLCFLDGDLCIIQLPKVCGRPRKGGVVSPENFGQGFES